MSSSASDASGNPPLAQHEINYTPSKWSTRYKDEELLARFFQFCERITAEVRRSLPCELDLPYGETKRTMYDLYGSNLPENSPLLIFIHGGYWQEFSKDSTGFAVPALVKHGIKVATIGYDLCPNVRIGDIVSEIKTAVGKILKRASDGGSRCVWISGHSAGAHLAGSLLHDKSWKAKMTEEGHFDLIKGILLIGGIYNLRPLLTTSFNAALTLSDDEVNKYSFSKLEGKDCEDIKGLRVVVAVGECDSPVFIEESRAYAQKLIEFVDNVEYLLLRDKTDHFDIVEKLVNEDYRLTSLLLKSMRTE